LKVKGIFDAGQKIVSPLRKMACKETYFEGHQIKIKHDSYPPESAKDNSSVRTDWDAIVTERHTAIKGDI